VKAITLFIVFLALTTSSAVADCLTEAAAFANRICGEVSNRGSAKLVTGSGELNAEAKGLIRRLLGSAGGELKGQTEISSYENVLREQLASELVNVRECGVRMAEAAMKQVCSNSAAVRIEQHTSGPNSPIINGNGNSVVPGK
jgi:hypothetical protein